MAEKTYIRKEVEELTSVPARRIQFYTENGVLSVDELRTGRGRERKYSRKNILELLVVNELAKMKVEFAEIRRIVNKLAKEYAPTFFDIDRLTNCKGGHYIHIYENGEIHFIKQKTTGGKVWVNMEGQLSVLIVNVTALAAQVPIE